MSQTGTVLLIGGGGHAAVVADAMRALGLRIIGFLDDDPSAALPQSARLGPIDSLREHAATVEIAPAATPAPARHVATLAVHREPPPLFLLNAQFLI